MPSTIPPPGEIQEELHFATLVLDVITKLIAVTTEDLTPTLTTDLTMSPGARESY